jgi:hypothetical protein
MAESYVRTALEIRELGELAFFGRFSGETARVCSGLPAFKSDDVARQVLELHQCHGQAIWDVLKAAVENHSADLVKRSLPPSSVLMIAVVPGKTPVLSSGGKPADPFEPLIEDVSETVPGSGSDGRYIPDGVRAPAPGGRGKSRPALERARGAIDELYPTGVPEQAVEPNTNLCRRVGEKLKQAGLPGVSDDTILRAAGRRT